MKEENDITQQDQNYIYIFLKIPILEVKKVQQWPESKIFPDNYSTKVVAILEKGTIVYLLNSTFGLLCGSVQHAGSRLEGIFTALQNSAVYAQASLNLNLNKRGSHCQYCSTLWGQMSKLLLFQYCHWWKNCFEQYHSAVCVSLLF